MDEKTNKVDIKKHGKMLRDLDRVNKEAQKNLVVATQPYADANSDPVDIIAQTDFEQDLRLEFVVDTDAYVGWLELSCLNSGSSVEFSVDQARILHTTLGQILGRK